MNRTEYQAIRAYMEDCMSDAAHDREHIYRVLYTALDIAAHEEGVNRDILIAACLLHDIGRKEQFENPALDHAQIGSEKAYRFLLGRGWTEADARWAADAIAAHRYRSGNPPKTIEAKILFDADKLDAAGAMGIARTLLYQGHESEPLYTLDAAGNVSDGNGDEPESFMHEYHFKLKGLYDRFFTERARTLAAERKAAAESFYRSLLDEARSAYAGEEYLDTLLEG